nr:hypothetical protein Iba_chr11aCG12480 [Ipomoea batatas]
MSIGFTVLKSYEEQMPNALLVVLMHIKWQLGSKVCVIHLKDQRYVIRWMNNMGLLLHGIWLQRMLSRYHNGSRILLTSRPGRWLNNQVQADGHMGILDPMQKEFEDGGNLFVVCNQFIWEEWCICQTVVDEKELEAERQRWTEMESEWISSN